MISPEDAVSAPAALLLAAGILGGLVSFAIANAWHYFLWMPPPASPQVRALLPDLFVFLLIGVGVGVGCGRAGRTIQPALSDLFATNQSASRFVPIMYTFVLGTVLGLIVHAVLLLMLLS